MSDKQNDVTGLTELLRGYNTPDRTIYEQRHIAAVIHKAANALERLAAENERLRLDVASWMRAGDWQQRAERAEAALGPALEVVARAESDLAACRAERDDAIGALKSIQFAGDLQSAQAMARLTLKDIAAIATRKECRNPDACAFPKCTCPPYALASSGTGTNGEEG